MIPGLKHLEVLQVFVDQAEAGGPTPTELGSEAEGDDSGWVRNVKLFGDIFLQ